MLEAGPALMEACAGYPKRQLEVLKTAVAKLFDLDDSVRRAAAAAVCTVLQQHPQLAGSTHTEGRGPVLTILFGRLRDKKLSVRREVASHLAALLRAWVLAAAESPDAAPHTRTMLSIPLALCHHAVRDPDLGSHVLDTVWRAGIFPAKLAPADVARYWAQMWFQARETGEQACCAVLAVFVRCLNHEGMLLRAMSGLTLTHPLIVLWPHPHLHPVSAMRHLQVTTTAPC